MSYIEDEPPPVLLPCTICSRTFRPEVLERHVKVCEKSATKKRRVFDSFKNRVSGTELEEFLGPAPLPGQPVKRPNKSPVKKRVTSKWKETHENLIATLRAARGVEPPPDTVAEAPKHSGNEQCPSCYRFFGPRAFDRHVEFCKEKTARIKMTPSKVSQAQERLEARTKYRAPLSIKPKLTTKEKYSPMLPRKESSENCIVTTSSTTKSSPPIPTLNKNSKPVKQNSSNFSRQSPIRSSERQRSVSPMKKSVVSSSKSSTKNEAQAKAANQPKIKENLKSPEDLRPKTGTKLTTQEKIRSSNPKHAHLEDEKQGHVTKQKKKIQRKSSDDESIATIESDYGKQSKSSKTKWSSSESISKTATKSCRKSSECDEEKMAKGTEKEKVKSKTRDVKSGGRKGNRQQKPIINDLSVNDESFGIIVAACSQRPPSSTPSKTSLRTVRSPEKCKEKKKEKVDKSPTKEKSKIGVVKKPIESEAASLIQKENPEPKQSKQERISKIPKPKIENKIPVKKTEEINTSENYEKESVLDEGKGDAIRQKARKWRNIAEMSTEDLAQMSEDFEMPGDDSSQQLSESAIWEIAAEQFLKSEESVPSTTILSVDSLNETVAKKHSVSDDRSHNCSDGDDFIVLHLTDPSKLVENDADMKLSISEPCFPYSDKIQKPRDPLPEGINKDIVVFAAFPNSIQSKAFHRKKKKQKRIKRPKSTPKLSQIRERTFLTNDFPKIKRQKLHAAKTIPPAMDLSDYFFDVTPTDELNDKKRRFIEGLKQQKEKIRKWQITANSHIRFMEEFEKSIDDDLRELKNLAKGKRIKKSCLKAFKKEKLKELKIEGERKKNLFAEESPKSKNKNFAYFEINFGGDNITGDDGNVDKVNAAKEETSFRKESPTPLKKFECFVIAADDFVKKPKRDKGGKKKRESESGESNVECKMKKVELDGDVESSKKADKQKKESVKVQSVGSEEAKEKKEIFDVNSKQSVNHQNASLENIEEVDEEEEDKKSVKDLQRCIEVEDFILSKPNTKKIFSKEDDCLDELFPKPRKIAETVTSTESSTAVRLGYTADSVVDLKSKVDRNLNVLPKIPTKGSTTRMLQKRVKKGSHFPQILVEDKEKKENSMMSLIELWKNKRENLDREKVYKMKATLPAGKLAPLTDKNSFQMAVLPLVLKQKLTKMVNEQLLEGSEGNESYDPFKQAERQMLALLSWPSTADIQSTKDLSPQSKSPTQKSNLTASVTSAFSKYPNKEGNKSAKTAKKNLNETFEVLGNSNKNNEKPMYTSADDWELIFEKHFDMNKNELTESVKSALDGLLKTSIKNNSNNMNESSVKNKSDSMESSVITEVLYTSTPKQNSKSDKTPNSRSKNTTVDLDQTPNTYRKSSNFTYGRITPPEDFNDTIEKKRKEEKTNRNSGISLSSLSFCSQISDTTLADEEVMRSNLEIIGKAAAAAAAKTPRRKYARSQSVFDERNKMLFAKTYDPNVSSSDENDVEVLPKIVDKGKKSPTRHPYPKSVPSHFSRSQSVMEDRCRGDGDHSDDGDHVSSPDSNRNRKAKLSGDSAYSSLNRRSPRQNVQQTQPEDRLSSSGSDHSLPPVSDFDPKPKTVDLEPLTTTTTTTKKSQPVKMSKFCHECGSKYPVAVAKFCCECGVRRLII